MKKPVFISTIVIIMVTSLLSGIEARTPLGKWKVIYLMAIPLAALILSTTPPRMVRISYGFVFLIIFYIVSTAPIFWQGEDTDLIMRRSLQVITLLCFGLSIC